MRSRSFRRSAAVEIEVERALGNRPKASSRKPRACRAEHANDNATAILRRRRKAHYDASLHGRKPEVKMRPAFVIDDDDDDQVMVVTMMLCRASPLHDHFEKTYVIIPRDTVAVPVPLFLFC